MVKPINLEFLGIKVGRLTFMACPKPEAMMVQAISHGALQALYTIFSPGWKDIFRYITGFSYSHRGQAVMTRAFLQEATLLNGFGRALFLFTLAADIALFWSAVIDGIRQGLYYWGSDIMAFATCNKDASPFEAKSTTMVGGWPSVGSWQIGPGGTLTGNPHIPFIGPILFLPAGYTGALSMAFTIQTVFGGIKWPFRMRIRDIHSNFIYDAWSTPDELAEGQEANMVWTSPIQPAAYDREIRLEIQLINPPHDTTFVPGFTGYCYLERTPPGP